MSSKVDVAIEDYHRMTSARLKDSSIFIQSYYVRHLKNCFHDLKIKRLNQIQLNTGYYIIDWYKKNTKNGNNSINKNIRFLMAVLRNNETKTSFYKFKLLKKDTKPFQRLYHDDLKLLINYVDEMHHSANSIIYRAVIYLLLDSGCRIGELLNIKISNIDFDRKQIYLEVTKNGQVRYAPFSNFSNNLIKEIIALDKNRVYLFWNFIRARQLNKSDMKNFYKWIAKKLNFDRLHSHRIRKTFGSILAENGMPIELIQNIFNHSRLDTTMIYINHTESKALDEYNKYADWKVS